MKKEIKYIGFYDVAGSHPKRVAAIAANNKMDYICDALKRIGYNVHLVSPSWFSTPDAKWEKITTRYLSANKKLTLCPSVGTYGKFTRNIKILLSLFWLFCFLIVHVKKQDTILVYHTPWLSVPIRIAKFIKRFRLILEVEEIYADISTLNKYFDFFEKIIIESADAYILSTELLKNKISRSTNSCVLYGVLFPIEKMAIPISDGKIHLLYSGIIDIEKRGAFNAVEASRFLSSDYVLHIIGFGDVAKLCKRIDVLNKKNACKILFDGIKSGDEYIRYSQSCHIGLSTQKMDGKYLESSFPSKILSYLCLGLRVVSCYVNCVATSQIHNLLNYYEVDSPEKIAQAIRSVDLTKDYDSISVIKQLDEKFLRELKILLEPNA